MQPVRSPFLLKSFRPALQAPHHTGPSWASYWSNHHDIPDKIFAAARGASAPEDFSDTNSEVSHTAVRKPNYVDSSSENGEGDSDSGDGQNASGDEVDDDDDEDDNEDDDDDDAGSVMSWDVSGMGRKGEAFTDADLYFTAKHIASFRDFDQSTGRKRWGSHSEKVTIVSACGYGMNELILE